MDSGVQNRRELPVSQIDTDTDTRDILGLNAAKLFKLDVLAGKRMDAA